MYNTCGVRLRAGTPVVIYGTQTSLGPLTPRASPTLTAEKSPSGDATDTTSDFCLMRRSRSNLVSARSLPRARQRQPAGPRQLRAGHGVEVKKRGGECDRVTLPRAAQSVGDDRQQVLAYERVVTRHLLRGERGGSGVPAEIDKSPDVR